MKLKIFNYEFFEYFKICPTKAVFSFYFYDMLSDGIKYVRKDCTEKMYKIRIIKKLMTFAFLKISEEKELSFEEFKETALLVLKEALDKKVTDNLNEKREAASLMTIKEEVIEQVKAELYDIYDLINVLDFKNVSKTFLKGYLEINNLVNFVNENYLFLGTRYKFKKKYKYEYEIPVITEESGQYSLILFTYSGIPKVKEEYDINLGLTLKAAEKLFPGKIFRRIVVYDLESLSRKSFIINEIQTAYILQNLYKQFIIVDTGMHFKNSGEHCKECNNSFSCYAELLKQDFFENIYDKNLKGKKLPPKEQNKMLNKKVKLHARKTSTKIL
jgi:hypothetical protein